ncbi:phosphoheptose isomerase [Arachidicoccus ginsenosidimutans]|uniref:D-sedoheptulose-7-phosphate isomerase n=1 Tax=Arachidicoccus sp. BS20 TaxID=1850526 RepID=UPI0007F0EA44|nr:SIS domain-containing protein [Arachidicoccus sp. BS20]ANI90020.1 phosphoheptose isomerase [Arachidicoccus sp. BS20]
MKDIITHCINESINAKQQILQDADFINKIESAVTLISAAFQRGNKVWFCGNGGSAADAQHLAAELSGRFYKDRKALPAEDLHGNISYLTAVANDYNFDVIYSRLLDGIGSRGDILIGLSTSGNSKNVLAAFDTAKEMGITTIGFTGSNGGNLAGKSDLLFNVPTRDTPRIQECHMLLGHIICQLVEATIFE